MNKNKFQDFCKKEKDLPLFLTYEWLESVAKNSWDVAVVENGNEIVGIFPFILFKKKGFNIIDHPPLTPYGGIWLKYPEKQKYNSRLSFEKETISALIEQLPSFDQFSIKFHPEFSNWLPFFWKKYNETTRYTYIINDLSDPTKVFNDFKESVRREIRKCENDLRIESSSNIQILLDLKDKSFQNNGIDMKVSSKHIQTVFALIKEKSLGELIIAKDQDKAHAAALFVWDNSSIYYLYGVADPNSKTSGAMSLIMWNIFQKFSTSGKTFNFEGSMIEGVERFFRGFGGRQTPYFHIYKTNSKILKIRSFLSDISQ